MQSITRAMPGAIVELLREGPLSPGKVSFAWKVVVGPAVDRVTAVRLEQGRLIVDASGRQWAREVTRASSTILGRMQRLLGAGAIVGLDVRTRT
jgi:hypothetical protein